MDMLDAINVPSWICWVLCTCIPTLVMTAYIASLTGLDKEISYTVRGVINLSHQQFKETPYVVTIRE
jgi:hypothetical protein